MFLYLKSLVTPVNHSINKSVMVVWGKQLLCSKSEAKNIMDLNETKLCFLSFFAVSRSIRPMTMQKNTEHTLNV